MPKKPKDYSKSVIYTLISLDPAVKDIYIGSTTNFGKRYGSHKRNCDNPASGNYNLFVYQYIREHGGWKNWRMEEIQKYPCKDEYELKRKEGEYIRQYNSKLNQQIAGRTLKEWYIDNKEDVLEKSKDYYEKNKDAVKERHKNYYENNKEKLRENNKVYMENNKDKFIEYRQKYYETNKGKIREKLNEKINCECGSCFSRGGKSTHEKSNKHKEYVLLHLTPQI